MRKIILNLAVTLDGFIEGPNGEIDWLQQDGAGGAGDFFDKFLPSVDAIFYGRKSYDLWGNYQPEDDSPPSGKKLWEMVHGKQKYVFSQTTNSDDTKAIFINGDLNSAVQQIREQPGNDIWLYGGGSLITSFINNDLIDEYILAIYPVILGSGKALFQNIKNTVKLRLDKVETSSGVMLAYYKTARR